MLLFVIGFEEINSKILFKNWLAFKALDLKFRSKKVFLFQEWTASVHNQGTHKEQSFLASYEFQFMLMQYNRPKNPSLIIHLMRWWSTDDCLSPETFKETHTDKVMITFWMMLLQIFNRHLSSKFMWLCRLAHLPGFPPNFRSACNDSGAIDRKLSFAEIYSIQPTLRDCDLLA